MNLTIYKNRKKIILTLVFAFVSHSFYAQEDFDKYDGQNDVASVIVNKKMFDLMSKVNVDASDKETQQYLELIKNLDNLKVFTTQNGQVVADMKLTADKHIKTVGLEKLMSVNDEGRNAKIYVKYELNNTRIKELLMFIEPAKNEGAVLLSITGNFDLDEILVLIDKMGLLVESKLKKVAKAKK